MVCWFLLVFGVIFIFHSLLHFLLIYSCLRIIEFDPSFEQCLINVRKLIGHENVTWLMHAFRMTKIYTQRKRPNIGDSNLVMDPFPFRFRCARGDTFLLRWNTTYAERIREELPPRLDYPNCVIHSLSRSCVTTNCRIPIYFQLFVYYIQPSHFLSHCVPLHFMLILRFSFPLKQVERIFDEIYACVYERFGESLESSLLIALLPILVIICVITLYFLWPISWSPLVL